MSQQTPEQPGTNPQPQDQPTPEQPETPGPTQPPTENKGSGQFAVWDHDLGQYVSGVSSKADADKARKGLESHNGAITDGHKLSTREV